MLSMSAPIPTQGRDLPREATETLTAGEEYTFIAKQQRGRCIEKLQQWATEIVGRKRPAIDQ